MRYLELLAPARDLACGIAAIDHGADAVYIGADKFGARAAAGNTVADIGKLCRYAHRFGAKVYVTVNTIIYEDELDATQKLVSELSEIGVDALLVQDMATLAMRRVALSRVGRAPLLHASTQLDNRSPEKVRWLRSLGFTRAVLARELTVGEVQAIHRAVPDMELEAFVHGALCVSFSGQCYASQCLFGRSANRGECAQVCRMKFDLLDADGETIVHDRYLLSMKDLCRIDRLEELADAGVTSFKIEGRLKGEDYVKNVVSAYSRRLDAIVSRRSADYCRASWGKVAYGFVPDLKKTFNRGYVEEFRPDTHRPLNPLGPLPQPLPFREGRCRTPATSTWFTPKALGEFVGTVASVSQSRPQWFRISPPRRGGVRGEVEGVREVRGVRDAVSVLFSNGDGLCFVDGNGELVGFRVNRADGGRLFPFRMPPGLRPGMSLYRNNDVAFEKMLKSDGTKRHVVVDMRLGMTNDGFRLDITAETGRGGSRPKGSATVSFGHQQARTPQRQNILKQLQRLGDTVYVAGNIDIDDGVDGMFIPSSVLADLRRKAVAALDEGIMKLSDAEGEKNNLQPAENMETEVGDACASGEKAAFWSPEYKRFPYLFNVANHISREFYEKQGLDIEQPAFEVREPAEGVVMQCRYCLRNELGFCVRRGGRKPVWKEPLTLRLGDGRRFRLEFKCDECQMNVYKCGK